MNVQTIYDFLNTYCPYDLAMDWDNPGLNVGRREREVSRVLLAMDITDRVIDRAIEQGCELIITHHPLIFDPLRQVNGDSPTAHYVLRLAENGIAHIACHTNLDAAEGGVNTLLAAACGMENAPLFGGIGRIADCETTLTALIANLKERLPAATCLGVKAHEAIHRIAVVGGSGGSMLEEAMEAGCDTFVTGEAKHNHALLAADCNINLLMLGHYETEYIALPPLAEALKAAYPALQVELMPHQAPLENL